MKTIKFSRQETFWCHYTVDVADFWVEGRDDPFQSSGEILDYKIDDDDPIWMGEIEDIEEC